MISLDQNVLENLVAAVELSTDECCGFFFGHEEGGHRVITKIMCVENSAREKFRNFEIASKDYLKAENLASHCNLQLLGVYHSHPNCPPIPSEYDRIAAMPYFSYIILSVINKKFDAIRSWNLNGNFQFEEESLSITYSL
jgi:proteasome lid subunit RPN8/RPN11